MQESVISESIRGTLSQSVSDLDPRLKRLEKVDRLADANVAQTMTELSPNEAIFFAALRAMDEEQIVKIPGTIAFFEELQKNRVSLDRKGRKEYLQGLIGSVPRGREDIESVGAGASLPKEEDKPSIWRRLQFWRRDD